MKINVQLEIGKLLELEQLLKEYLRCFCMDIQRSERDSFKLAQHRLELDITIPPAHQTRYILNPNYVTTGK